MPPMDVYAVNFANGTLAPTLDVNGWGSMRFGGSAAGALTRTFENGGLRLSATRDLNASDDGVQNSVYVLPPQPGSDMPGGVVPIETRLLMRVDFELPDAVAASPQVKVEPWAVCLRLKFATDAAAPERDDMAQPMINVTCQFNNHTNERNGIPLDGVRLNDPDRAQKAEYNQAADLDSPLFYGRYRPGCLGLWPPTLFTLSFAFSGIQAGPAPSGPRSPGDPLGYATCCGFLEMRDVYRWVGLTLRKDTKKDLRVFSSDHLSTGMKSCIDALGVSLTTKQGHGTFTARLKRFAVSTWP